VQDRGTGRTIAGGHIQREEGFMAHWLVCFSAEVAPGERFDILARPGIEVLLGGEAVPLGEEVAVRVSGERRAVETLRHNGQVRGVFPDSEPEPY
jgi:hypothetical protein